MLLKSKLIKSYECIYKIKLFKVTYRTVGKGLDIKNYSIRKYIV